MNNSTYPSTRPLVPTLIGALLFLSPFQAAHSATAQTQGSWQVTLKARDLDGDKVVDAYYDTELNITWLRNWNLGAGSIYDTPYGFGTNPATDGLMVWKDALAWADNLTIGGYTGWRLPTMTDTGSPGCNFSFAGGTDCGYNVRTRDGSAFLSELAHMWYDTLGNRSYCTPGDINCATAQPRWGLTNAGPFSDVGTDSYWSGLAYYAKLYGGDAAWRFGTYDGRQSPSDIYATFFSAVAVHNGDVGHITAIPEPATWKLTFVGLCLMAGVLTCAGRRRFLREPR